MAQKVYHQAFNVGVIDDDKQHRIDVDRTRLAADIQTNFMVDAVGKAFFRPGTGRVAITAGELRARVIPFIAGPTDSFVLELTDYGMRVIDCDDDTVVGTTFAGGGASLTNPTFTGGGGGWTLAATVGQVSTLNNQLELTARAHGGEASAKQSKVVGGGGYTANTEYVIKLVVTRGPVMLRIGTTDGGSELLPFGQPMVLRTGTHFIAFTAPAAGTVWHQLSSSRSVMGIVASCDVEAGTTGNPGYTMLLPTPWPEAALGMVRIAQSLDVTFAACAGIRPMRIERHGDHSWGICDYMAEDGPFLVAPTADITLTPGALEGNTTLTASRPFFQPGHVGALFQLTHDGQMIDTYIAGAGQFTPTFEVTGIMETNFEERKWTWTISGTWSGTITTQRSFDGPEFGFHDMRSTSGGATIPITSNAASQTNDDNDDNAVEWVRYGFKGADYTSGEARVQVTYAGGAGTGIARVTGYVSATQVTIEILTPFSGNTATKTWVEGRWSGVQGWPNAVLLADGRLWFAGSDQFDASVSDAYESMSQTLDQNGNIGDSSAISRSIALGGRNESRWMVGLISPIIGTDARVAQVRANSLDEVITPGNIGVRSGGKVGAAAVSPAELADDRAVFVERAGTRLHEITWSGEKVRYVVNPFSKLTTKIFDAGIIQLDVQTLPDQRIWCVMADGTLNCIVIEPTQQVVAFLVFQSRPGDKFHSVCVVPGAQQDRVYVTTERKTAVQDEVVRMVEKFALDTEALAGAELCKCMDAFVVVTGNGTNTVTDARLAHMEGQGYVAWARGAPVVDPTKGPNEDNTWFEAVGSNSVTLPFVLEVGEQAVIGLPYTARLRTARLAYGAPGATPLSNKQKLAGVGLLLADYVRSGVLFGTKFDTPNVDLLRLPLIHGGTGTTADEIVVGPDVEEPLSMLNGQISFDERLCVEMKSPKPGTLLGMVLAVETY